MINFQYNHLAIFVEFYAIYQKIIMIEKIQNKIIFFHNETNSQYYFVKFLNF